MIKNSLFFLLFCCTIQFIFANEVPKSENISISFALSQKEVEKFHHDSLPPEHSSTPKRSTQGGIWTGVSLLSLGLAAAGGYGIYCALTSNDPTWITVGIIGIVLGIGPLVTLFLIGLPLLLVCFLVPNPPPKAPHSGSQRKGKKKNRPKPRVAMDYSSGKNRCAFACSF